MHNTPAWDCWIAFFNHSAGDRPFTPFLLAYIPPLLVALVDHGIWANPEECVIGLDDAPEEVRVLI